MIPKSEIQISAFDLVAKSLSSAKIRYGVANGIYEYPQRIGRDIDIIVIKSDYKAALNIITATLEGDGWICIIHKKSFTCWITAWKKNYLGEINFLEFDLFWRLQWAFTRLSNGATDTKRSFPIGPYLIDGPAFLTKVLLLQLATGNENKILKAISEGICLKIAILNQDWLESILGKNLTNDIIYFIENKDHEKLLTFKKEIRSKFIKFLFKNQLIFLPRNIGAYIQLKWEWLFLRRRATPIIIFLSTNISIGKIITSKIISYSENSTIWSSKIFYANANESKNIAICDENNNLFSSNHLKTFLNNLALVVILAEANLDIYLKLKQYTRRVGGNSQDIYIVLDLKDNLVVPKILDDQSINLLNDILQNSLADNLTLNQVDRVAMEVWNFWLAAFKKLNCVTK